MYIISTGDDWVKVLGLHRYLTTKVDSSSYGKLLKENEIAQKKIEMLEQKLDGMTSDR